MNIENLRSDVRRWGWMRALFIRVMSYLERYAGIHIYRVHTRSLGQHPHPPKPPSGMTLHILTPEELLKAAGDPELDMSESFVRAALARGDLAFGAFDGNHLAGYVWRTVTAAPVCDGLWARVNPPYHYSYKGFIRPPYRGKRIHAAISLLLCDPYFLERGYTGETGYTDIHNFASIASHNFTGRQRIGFAGYVQWFGYRIPFRTSGAKKIGFEFFEARY